MQWCLTCGLKLGLKVMLVEDGPLMEGWPMGELMTGNGEDRPLMGELRVLMGECSWPGLELMADGLSRGWWRGWLLMPRWPVEELKGDDKSWPEESAGWREGKRVTDKGNFRNILHCEVNNAIVSLFGYFTLNRWCGKVEHSVQISVHFKSWQMTKFSLNFWNKKV